jgi:ketosteroid isomerase-like protein
MNEMVRVLQRGYEMIWREGRIREALIGLDADFEWVVPDHPEGDVRYGPEATIDFFRDWTDSWAELEVDWELRSADPARVLAIITMKGRGPGSGAPAEMHVGQLWTFEDGRAVRMVMYTDVDEALREAGLAAKSPSELAREGFEAYRRGGIDAVLPTLTDDVVWEDDPDWPDSEIWHGREGARQALAQRLESTSITPELEDIVERGQAALVLMRWTAEGRGSGAVADLRVGVVYDFDGELVRRARFFLDQDRARQAFESD